jgi:hypothetical protein
MKKEEKVSFYLILEIYPTYKFIIPFIKENKKFGKNLEHIK